MIPFIYSKYDILVGFILFISSMIISHSTNQLIILLPHPDHTLHHYQRSSSQYG